MLLGLGGLYGASNLVSTTPGASANPVKPPELDKCGTATNLNTGGTPLDVDCCPPISRNIIDYRLPPVHQIKIRPSAHRVSPEYILKYNMATDRLRRLPKDDPHPTFALPFWNWDSPKGMTIPPVFLERKSALYDAKHNQANLPPAVIDLGMTGNTDTVQVVDNNLSIMYNEMIRGNSDVFDFMGQPYREGTAINPGPGAAERGSHTAVHVPDKRITDPDFLSASFLFYDENKQLVRVSVKDSLDNLRMGYDYERIDIPWLNYKPSPQKATTKVFRIGTSAPKADTTSTMFPLTLDKIVKVLVRKTKKGKADELLVIENITVDTTKFHKFDVFVNDEDDDVTKLDKAAYVGTYAQVPHKTANRIATTSIRHKLTDVYDDMDVGDDDDTVVVTLVPGMMVQVSPSVVSRSLRILIKPATQP
ncbi:hypothetical protein BUALT_Bualt03G0203100 [Buddleja alternifolia]|uniref:Polyphenol oxidase n=1 Tax=Buddleja alternifolia TaxID=168488 RepID=A0AAV6XVB4_9LAMI|nr:hypothetical protein BUALT_Bualt03G0203100 [Buddleja alternifolia]